MTACFPSFCAPIGFDLETGNFTNLDARKEQALKELCPGANFKAEMIAIACTLISQPETRPDGSFGLIAYIVGRLQAAQARANRAAKETHKIAA